ncbi:MAG: hypothetical protein D6785_03415, partial [Planctomycetota bacterium]
REFPSEERRLTTISEGLALYPYKEKKSSHFFGGYSIWDSQKERHIQVVPQHASKEKKTFSAPLPVCPEYPRLTITLFRRTIDYEFLLNLVDIPFEKGQIPLEKRFLVEMEPLQGDLFPKVALWDREKEDYLIQFSSETMSEEDLVRLFEQEKSTYQCAKKEVVPPSEWSWRPCPKLLEVGDVVRVVEVSNGKRIESKPFLITTIIHPEEGLELSKVENWRFSQYLINGKHLPNRDIHLLSLDKVLVEERESIAEKLEQVKKQSKIVRLTGVARKEILEENDSSKEPKTPISIHSHMPNLSSSSSPQEDEFDEEKVFTNIFRSFKKLSQSYHQISMELHRLKKGLRNLEDEAIVRSELDLEIGFIKKQLGKLDDYAIQVSDLSNSLEYIHVQINQLKEAALEVARNRQSLEVLEKETALFQSSLTKVEEQSAQLIWDLEQRFKELSSFFGPLEKAVTTLREQVGQIQNLLEDQILSLPQQLQEQKALWEAESEKIQNILQSLESREKLLRQEFWESLQKEKKEYERLLSEREKRLDQE